MVNLIEWNFLFSTYFLMKFLLTCFRSCRPLVSAKTYVEMTVSTFIVSPSDFSQSCLRPSIWYRSATENRSSAMLSNPSTSPVYMNLNISSIILKSTSGISIVIFELCNTSLLNIELNAGLRAEDEKKDQ